MIIDPKIQATAATINGLTDTFTVTPSLSVESWPEQQIYNSNAPAILNMPENLPEINLSDYRMEDFGEAINLLSAEDISLSGVDSICD